jgi:PAS domain S-box-containing protein
MSSSPESKLIPDFHERPELEEVLHAIRTGLVDAVLVETLSGEKVYTLNPAGSIEEHNEILQAIRTGRVDALLVKTPTGDQVFSLQTTDEPYRILVETMQEGTATLNEDGTVLYANARFAEIMNRPMESVLGFSLYDHFASGDGKLRKLVKRGLQEAANGEVGFTDVRGHKRMLRLALSPLPTREEQSHPHTACLVVTDVTELFEASESLRSLSTRVLQLQDEERKRISRDLHDSAGQHLAVAAMVLGELDKATSSSPDGSLRSLVQTAQNAIQECSNEVRTISYLLHPPTLEALGLASAIQWYSQGFGERSGIAVDVEISPSLGRLQQDVELTLYRVVQEALTNIHRHSGSKWAAIRLIQDQNQIRLEVADRGKGMPLLASDGSPLRMGVGTSGMRERVRELNGDFTIDSSEHGTTVRVTLNLPNPSN